jgi:Na+/proline symporter/signal transduction histidine kinase
MNLSFIDYTICFLAVVVLIFIGVKKAGKVKGILDYAVSNNQRFSTPVLAMTFIVTAIGSNASIGSITEIYNNGLIYMIFDAICLVGAVLVIQYAAKFMAGRYVDKISLYGIMEQEYGQIPAKISASVSVIISVIALAMQIIGMGYIAKIFFGTSFYIGASLSSVIFITYSSLGGIRGVVYTDVMQFFVVLVVFPILVGVLVYNVGGIESLFLNLPQEKLRIINHPDFTEYSFLTLFWMMPFGLLYPAFIQRFLMCDTGNEINKMGMSWVLFYSVFVLMIGTVGLSSIILLTDVSSGKEVIPLLMEQYFPSGLKGLAIAAFFAIVMSTADSFLNAATVLVVEIFTTEEERKKQEEKRFKAMIGEDNEEEVDDEKGRRVSLITFGIGGLAFLLAMLDFSFIRFETVVSAFAFSAVNIPVFFAPFKNRKIKTINAYKGSIISGFSAFLVLWSWLGSERLYMVSFFAVFFAISGWFIGANFFDKTTTILWKRLKESYGESVKISKFIKVPKGYSYFVIFGIISFLMRYGLTPWDFFSEGYIVLSATFTVSCIFLFSLGFGDKIKGINNKIFLVLWLGAMFFTLPFYNMVALLQDPADSINSASLLVAVFLVNLLFDWRISLIMFLLTIVSGIVLNANLFYQDGLLSTPKQIFLIIYLFMSGVLVSMFLKKVTDSASKEKLEYAYTMAGSVAHELQTPIMEVGGWLEFIPPNSLDKNSITQDKLDEIKKVLLSIRGSYNNSVDTIRRTMQVFTMGRQGRDVVDTDLNMAELVADAVKTVRIEDSKRDRIRISITPDLVVHAYANNLITILHNLIRNAAMYSLSKDKKATIRIYNEGRDVIVYDDGVGIRSDRILTIFDRGTSYDSKRGSGFGLYYCKIEMERLGGRIRCYSREGEFTKFVLSFPEVRAKKAHKNRPVKRNRMRFQ